MTIIFGDKPRFTDFHGTSMSLNNKTSYTPHSGRILNCVENIGSKCYNSHITNLFVKNIEIICIIYIYILVYHL